MPKSVIDPMLEYDNGNWVVAMLTQDDKESSLSKNAHVQISVEGLINGEKFIGRYELHSNFYEELPEPRYYILADNNQRNPRLRIDRFAYQFSYRKEKKLVEAMIASIEAEAKSHQNLIRERQQINLPVYSRMGGYSAQDEQGRPKHSCASWANEKIKMISEEFKPKAKEVKGIFPFFPLLRHPRVRQKAIVALSTVGLGLFVALKIGSSDNAAGMQPKL